MNPYLAVAAAALPRAFALQDADPASARYGACDRAYWHYRTVRSFPSAPFQQLALAFAQLHEVPGHTWSGAAVLRDRSAAALAFWAQGCVRRDGSVDEWYRNERSYCATAFSVFAMAETLLLWGERLPAAVRDVALAALRRAGAYLAESWNPAVMNQNLAACAGLWNLSLASGEAHWRPAAERAWARLREGWCEEGWFREYGGADAGYASIALDLLAALARRGAPFDLDPYARQSACFLASLLGPAGGLAEGLGSRGTAHAFAFGARFFARTIPAAATLAAALEERHARAALIVPPGVDDRYFATFYMPLFALAASVDLDGARGADPTPGPAGSLGGQQGGHGNCGAGATPGAPAEELHWPVGGLRIARWPGVQVVLSTRRGGALIVQRTAAPTVRLGGYWAITATGERWSSCGWAAGSPASQSEPAERGLPRGPGAQELRWECENAFVAVDHRLPLERWEVPFHVWTRVALSSRTIADRFQRWLKRRRIERRATRPLQLLRRVACTGAELLVEDRILRTAPGPAILRLVPTDRIEVVSPSARLDLPGEVPLAPPDLARDEDWARCLSRDGELVIRWRLALD